MTIFKLIESERKIFSDYPLWLPNEEYFRLENLNLFSRSEYEDSRLTIFLNSDPKGTIEKAFSKLLNHKKEKLKGDH